jgi:hypothetical protein
MRLVIDSNKLQSEELQTFLSKSKENFAVLTDFAAMEAYKGNTPTIFESMAILSDFPDQVLVLKNTCAVLNLRGRCSGLQRRLIDQSQTSDFANYAKNLRHAREGNLQYQHQLKNLGYDATTHLDKMLGNAATMATAIIDIGKLYSKEERRTVRLKEHHSSEFIDKSVKKVLEMAGIGFQNQPNVNFVPSYAELPNTFIFRLALSHYLLALDWIAFGGVKDVKPAILRNDFVDANFVAYATFFDGLMSSDAKALRIHNETRLWLSELFDCKLP